MVRATPMPPDERRAAIIAATEPLLLSRGHEVSTREIAEAAGIAEGTIFRVFTTKDSLIEAVFAQAFDPQAGRDELARIDPDLDLEARLTQVVAIVQRRLRRVFGLFHVLGFRHRAPGPNQPWTSRASERTLGVAAIAAVIEPDRDQLRTTPTEAAALLNALVLALTHPMLSDQEFTDPGEIARLLLHGIASPTPARSEGSAC